jgi:hypothetical protein
MTVTSVIVNSMPCADYEHDSLIRATQIFERRCTCLPEFFVVSVQSDKNPSNGRSINFEIQIVNTKDNELNNY